MKKINTNMSITFYIFLFILVSLSSSTKLTSLKGKLESNIVRLLGITSTLIVLTPIPAMSANVLSNVASKLPGMGPPDVAYPKR